MSTHYKIIPRLEITMTSKTNSILFASLLAVTLVAFSGINSAYAYTESHPEDFTRAEADKITSLAKQVYYIEILIDELEREDSKTNTQAISSLETELDSILEYVNPLGLYTSEQYAVESLDRLITPTEAQYAEVGITKICGCDNEMAWRAGLHYKLWGLEGDGYGSWKYSQVLHEQKTSIAYVGYWVPDWIEPFAQGVHMPTATGDLEYTLELRSSSGNLIIDYGNHLKGVTSNTINAPNQWDENRYNNPASGDKIEMEGNADSWT